MPDLNTQGALPFELDERELKERICRMSGKPVSLSITSNRVSVLSARFLSGKKITEPRGINLRLHRIFLKAGTDVIEEIARFISGGRKGKKTQKNRFPLLSQYIKANEAELKRSGAGRKVKLKACGRFYDLDEIYASLNREYFEGRISCAITWGRKQPSPGCVRKRTLGSFSCDGMGPGRGLIRVNPVLDRKNVPPYYVRLVVYHEMLHADMGIGEKNGRRSIHSPQFRKRERLFRDFDRAMAFEKGGKRPGKQKTKVF